MPVEQCLKFTVERLTFEEGQALIVGRNCALPFRVGDTFTKIFGFQSRWDPELDERVALDPSPIYSISLVVRSIQMQHKSWDELPSGYVAGVTVAGTGLDMLAEGRLIGDDAAV